MFLYALVKRSLGMSKKRSSGHCSVWTEKADYKQHMMTERPP